MSGIKERLTRIGCAVRSVPVIGWALEHFGEFLLVTLLFLLLLIVLAGLYAVPSELKPMVAMAGLVYLIMVVFVILLLALYNRLQFRMGFRNLIRHRSDSIIAVLGFMIGTSIICSSMAIGDTMDNMMEELIYESFHLYDEQIQVIGPDGRAVYFNGSEANEIASIAWSLNDGKKLIDGVSWEVLESGSIINIDSSLFEPSVSLKAHSPNSTGAFGGFRSGGSSVDLELGPGEAAVTESLAEKIAVQKGHTIMLNTWGGTGTFIVKHILDVEGRSATFSRDSVYLSFEGIWGLFNLTTEGPSPKEDRGDWSLGFYNVFYISNEGGKVEGAALCKEVIEKLEEKLSESPHPLGEGVKWEVNRDKDSSVKEAKSQMEQFSKLFLILGTFTIIAGVTLIINIFVMLSEERMEEMGISRAIGMRRKHLRRIYLFEGTAYSILSSSVGVLFGIFSGYLIILFIQRIFENMGITGFSMLEFYTVTPTSIILSFVAGFAITISTTLFITQRVARLNIVSAIRNTPVPKGSPGQVRFFQGLLGVIDPRTGEGDGSNLSKVIGFAFSNYTITGMALLVIGGLLAAIGIPSKTGWSSHLGISLLIIGASFLIRHFLSQRLTFNIAALLLLGFWTAPIPFFKGYSGDLEMFILSGMFMVSSGVLLLVWNTDIILWIAEKALSLIRVSPASVKMAISYPVKKRFRTGVTIFMFALIIFTITGMSMIIEIFNVNISSFERSIGGGYNLIGVSTVGGIQDLEGTVSVLDPINHTYIDWDNTHSLSYGYIRINYTVPMLGTKDEMMYPCAGVSERFIERNTYGFSDVAWELIDEGGKLERTDDLVWRSLDEGRFVILDGGLAPGNMFGFGSPLGAKLGDNLTLVNYNNTHINRTVLAFTEQFGISGVFMYEERALADFGIAEKRIHLIALSDDGRTSEVSEGLRRNLLPYGFYTVIISEIVKDILKSQNAFFDLFNAFLSLGLIIGIVGLGIVTLRSVYERRHEIGMMRAIGFKRRMVVGSFLGESGFIAGSGLIIGSGLGIILGWILWRDEGFGQDFDQFGIPYVKLLFILGLAFAVALISSIPPSLKASRIAPADALRYE